MAMNAKQRRHLIQQNQQDGNECQTKKTLNTTKLVVMNDGNECQTKKTLNNKTSRMAMNAKQRRHLIQQNQQDGNECQTKKTLNTTKLVGWQ